MPLQYQSFDVISEARHNFPTPKPGWLSSDNAQTIWIDLDPGTQVEGVEDDEGSISVGVRAALTSSSMDGGAEEMPLDHHSDAEGGSHTNSDCSSKGGDYCHCRDRCGNHFNDSCRFCNLYLHCTSDVNE